MGRMWTATTGGVGWVDRDTLVAGDKVMLPEQTLHRGISVDIDSAGSQQNLCLLKYRSI